MIARTCVLPAFLIVLGSTSAAQLQIVQQTRSISGLAHAQSEAGMQHDTYSVSAPDAGPFQVNDSANAAVTAAAADSSASQSSQFAGDRITASGQASVSAWADHGSASSYSNGESNLAVSFSVTDTVEYSLTGSIQRSPQDQSPTVQLEQGGSVIHVVTLPSGGGNSTSFEFRGVLSPGTYALSAVTPTQAGGIQYFTDTSYGTFQVVFAVEPLIGAPYCAGDGTGTPCPCANNSTPGWGLGCLNSLEMGGKLRASGSASLSNDTLALVGSQMLNSFALYFQGTIRHSGGNGVTFGDGKLCAGGTITRLGRKPNTMGASRYPSAGDASISSQGSITSPGTRTYQAWYRNAAAFCTASNYNMTNAVEVLWGM